MNDTLFDIPEQKSPRLKWIESRGVKTERDSADLCRWYAWNCGGTLKGMTDYNRRSHCATGATEQEALANLAISQGLRLWNEENL